MKRKFITLVRRELWEYKNGFITLPVVCTIILSVLLSIGYLRLAPQTEPSQEANTHAASQTTASTSTVSTSTVSQSTDAKPGDANHGNLNEQFSEFSNLPVNELPIFSHIDALRSAVGFMGFSQWVIAAMLNIVLLIVILNYAHRAMFDDRKNREILFWRSMPVAETENLGAKLFIIYGFAPLILFANILLGSIIFWLATLGNHTGGSLQALMQLLDSFAIYKKSLLFLLTLLPVVTWTLLASAYAKKSPFMLSAILPVGLIFIDRIVHWATGINLYIRTTVNAYTDFVSYCLQGINQGFTTAHIISAIPYLLLSALLCALTIWLRNNRYEL